MTAPIYIKPLIELYCSEAKENLYWFEREYGVDIKGELLEMGLIRHCTADLPENEHYHHCKYELTKRGLFYIKSLLNVPLPEQIWVTP